ncbi:MAG: hypothetical protein ABIG95_06390, partial [Candidatus Woesearchaeota archaeon]
MKKGQVSVFLIVGIAVLVSIALLFLIKSKVASDVLAPEREDAYMLVSEKARLSEYVDSCLERTLKNGYQHVGLDQDLLKYYINSELYECVDVSEFEREGVKASRQRVKADVTISDSMVAAKIDFSITLVKADSLVEVEEFVYSVERAVSHIVATDALGKTTDDIKIVSADKQVEIEIKRGTQIFDGAGQPLVNPELSIFLNALEEQDATIYGYRIYNLEPSGIRFRPAAKIRMLYDDSQIDQGEAWLAIVKREND